MTKLDVVSILVAFGPGLCAAIVYVLFLQQILFRNPEIRCLKTRIRRRIFLAVAFWPVSAFIPGMVVALFLCGGDLFPRALSFLVSYAAGMLLLMPWYPRLPFLGRCRQLTDWTADVSLVRRSLAYASFVALVAWFLVAMGISGGRLGEHFMEGGARSIEKQLGTWVSVSSFPDRGGGHYERPRYPTHPFCLLCWEEQRLRHSEVRREWREAICIPDWACDSGKTDAAEDCGDIISGGD